MDLLLKKRSERRNGKILTLRGMVKEELSVRLES